MKGICLGAMVAAALCLGGPARAASNTTLGVGSGAVAGALVGAVLIGWVLHWMFSRANGVSGPRNARRTADLAHRLHLAEEAQHRAEARLREVEVDLRQRNVDLQAELAAVQQTLERVRAEAERQMSPFWTSCECSTVPSSRISCTSTRSNCGEVTLSDPMSSVRNITGLPWALSSTCA